MKIASISTTKNECDVIEAFVRHNARFCDKFFFIDESVDQTRTILKALQEEGFDTVEANLKLGLPADLRDYGIGAQILTDLGLSSIRILTNNPKKIIGLEGYGLSVSDQVPIIAQANPHNEAYLRAKEDRMGHTLHHQGISYDDELVAKAKETEGGSK
jgi:3,4-dihydroxy 2-butanone 4-phosphate synthase/GTP cyclohydrolase II